MEKYLTGAAYNDLDKWAYEYSSGIEIGCTCGGGFNYDQFPQVAGEAVAIHWFETVGIAIGRDRVTKGWWVETDETYSDKDNNYFCYSDLETVQDALLKASEIYNNKKAGALKHLPLSP